LASTGVPAHAHSTRLNGQRYKSGQPLPPSACACDPSCRGPAGAARAHGAAGAGARSRQHAAAAHLAACDPERLTRPTPLT
jgi:hypothetical protein